MAAPVQADEPGAPARPRDDRGEPATPGEVIVVTEPVPVRPIRDVATPVTVLDRRELARSPRVLADDLVRTVPWASTFRRSSSAIADPTSQGLSLRGVGSSAVSRALVLRDGVPENDPFGGWMYWRGVSPLDLQRIEIAPGGAAVPFGNVALGGVVRLVSRPIEAIVVEVRAFVDYVQRASTLPLDERLANAHSRLSALYTAALALPPLPEPGSVDAGPRPANPEGWQGFEDHDLYWMFFDPYDESSLVAGSLSDDVLDIYADVSRGLALWDASHTSEAIWEWRFQFDIHWGAHAVNALGALHRACNAWS